jgi:two-component sensor histidine kinase
VRIRRAEHELVRLNAALAELAAENGRLYERARRDAEGTTLLLRELQHRVRNNLAAIQALLVLERHRTPARPLSRSMAALQDSLVPHETEVDVASLVEAVSQSAFDVFGAADVRCEVQGNARLPARRGSAMAIVLNELITNVVKHAGATAIYVQIRNDGHLQLEVTDDGHGMPAHPTGGSGLMIARAVVKNELAGDLTVLPQAKGTCIRITLPPPH